MKQRRKRKAEPERMHAARVLVEGNAFPGLFARASEAIAITGRAPPGFRRALERVLGTTVLETGIAGSPLAGLYCALNSNGIVLPATALGEEVAALKRAGLNTAVLRTPHTALGNNIVANDRGALANPRMKRGEVAEVSDALGVEVVPASIAGYNTVGSVCVATNRGFLAHNDAGEEELRAIESVLKVKGGIGTCNMGVPFVGLCLVANSRGYLAGEPTTGFELARIDQALELV
ncbi:MAG: translation initiation factor IF-6 [Candidatus Micrarchaeia archaeon]